MKDKLEITEMISEIEKELGNLRSLKSELIEIKGKSDMISRRAQGSILHDFYNCCERIFRRIAEDINERKAEDSEKWHRKLLVRMTMEIKDIRPIVISDELAAELDDYLGFRHVFRNIYGFELRGERVVRLIEKFDRVLDRFTQEMNSFLGFLKRTREKL